MRERVLSFVELQTINQAVEALGQKRVEFLALDIAWFEDPKWIGALCTMAQIGEIPVTLLTNVGKPTMFLITPGNLERIAEFFPPRPKVCVEIDVNRHEVRHLGHIVQMPERAQHLLSILVYSGAGRLTLDQVNQEASRRSIAPWTYGSFKTTVFLLRKIFGSHHFQTERRIGYWFQSCHHSQEQPVETLSKSF